MKFFTFALVALLSLQAQAKLGSECGLTDLKNDEWKRTKLLNVSEWDEKKVKGLDTLTKQQIIITAKELTAGDYGLATDIKVTDAWSAVRALKETSEGEDMYVNYYDVKNLKVTEVLLFPGGNPVGKIFKTGTKKVLADNGDDTITCR